MLTQWFSCFAGPQTGLCIWRFLLFLTAGLAALRQQSCRRVSVFSPCWPACRKRAPLRRSFLFFLLFLHIKDSLKMMMNGVIDKRFWDVRNDSFYLYENRIKSFLVSLVPKQFCVFEDSFYFAYGYFRSWPLCCWEHMVFSSAWQNCSQQKLFLFGGAFLLFFAKKEKWLSPLFSFFSSCLSCIS